MLHSKGIRIGCAVVLAVQLAGWVAALGGLAKATDECRKATTEWVVGGSGLEDEDTRFFGRAQTGHIQPFTGAIAPHYNGSRAYQCGVHFSLDWWIVAFELALTVFGFMATFSEMFHTKHTVNSFYAIGTSLVIIFTSFHIKFGYMFSGGVHARNEVGQAFKAAAVGGVIMSVCNYAFLFLFGMDEEDGAEETSEAIKA